MSRFLTFSILSCLFVMYSCDASLILSYRVHNHTDGPIQLAIYNYPSQAGLYAENKDTIVELEDGAYITVAYHQDIGFPWETKKIYNNNKGVTNFDLIVHDTVIPIDKSDDFWTYKGGSSNFKIKKQLQYEK